MNFIQVILKMAHILILFYSQNQGSTLIQSSTVFQLIAEGSMYLE